MRDVPAEDALRLPRDRQIPEPMSQAEFRAIIEGRANAAPEAEKAAPAPGESVER